MAESGSGKTHLAKLVSERTGAIYCNYTGSVKTTLKKLAEAIGCPTKVPTAKAERDMNTEELKVEIQANLDNYAIIIDNIQRWPASLKYWLEGLAESGVCMLLLGTKRDLEGLSFKMPKVAIQPLSDSELQSLMYSRATELGLSIPSWRVSELAARAGGNPMLAYRLLDEVQSGIADANTLDSAEYIDITPFILATLMLCSAVRFIGMAMDDRALYILGGLSLTAFVMLKYGMKMFDNADRRR